MAAWLTKHSKFFSQMTPELALELAKLVFVIPNAGGGGFFEQGQPVICRGVRPRMIYIVYEGKLRRCTMLSKSNKMETLDDSLSVRLLDQEVELGSESDYIEAPGLLEFDGIPLRDENGDLPQQSEKAVSQAASEYDYNKKAPSTVLEVGSVFGYAEFEEGLMIMDDYLSI